MARRDSPPPPPGAAARSSAARSSAARSLSLAASASSSGGMGRRPGLATVLRFKSTSTPHFLPRCFPLKVLGFQTPERRRSSRNATSAVSSAVVTKFSTTKWPGSDPESERPDVLASPRRFSFEFRINAVHASFFAFVAPASRSPRRRRRHPCRHPASDASDRPVRSAHARRRRASSAPRSASRPLRSRRSRTSRCPGGRSSGASPRPRHTRGSARTPSLIPKTRCPLPRGVVAETRLRAGRGTRRVGPATCPRRVG